MSPSAMVVLFVARCAIKPWLTVVQVQTPPSSREGSLYSGKMNIILELRYVKRSLPSPVFGCIEDPGEVFVTVEDEGSFAGPGCQGNPLPGIEMVEQDPLKLTPISRRFSEESGYQSKSENAAEYE